MGTATELSEIIAAYNAFLRRIQGRTGFSFIGSYLSDDQESLNNVKAWETLSKWKAFSNHFLSEEDTIMKDRELLKYYSRLQGIT
jgi:hypothetical protein